MSRADKEALRAILHKAAVRLFRVALTPSCHRNIEELLTAVIDLLQMAKREARRKKRSKDYNEFRRTALNWVANADLGIAAHLTSGDLKMASMVLDAMIDSLAGKSKLKNSDGTEKEFLDFQKRIFVPAKKRGPKNRPLGDEAYARYRKGEGIADIARDLYPDELDPVNAIQKVWRAIQRRKRERTPK
jgi:hypothetical protein